MTPKSSPILRWPKVDINKIFISQYFFSSATPTHPPPQKKKNIKIQKFEAKIMVQAYVCMNISEYPTPSLGVASVKINNV